MTAIGLKARPRLHPDIVLGPPLRRGATVTHAVKDRRTGRYFQLGAREHFIVSRLDGHTTLAEVGVQYAEAFRRRLDPPGWDQVLDLLTARRLLADQAVDQAVAAASPPAQQRGGNLLRYRLPLVNPDRFFGWVEPRTRLLFSRYVVVPCLVLVTGLVVWVAMNAASLLAETRLVWQTPSYGIAAMVALWLGLAAHEAAHGLTCKHFGGSATAIGVLWRFPLLAPYCEANDVVLFHRRRDRFLVAFAGVYTSLLVIVPVAVVWHLVPPGSPARHASALVLVAGSVGALLNFVPFLRLDGYFMLNHALGMQNLRRESYRYLWRRLRAGLGAGHGETACPRGAAAAYFLYGTSSILFGTVLAGWFLVAWFGQMQGWMGTGSAWVALGCQFALGLGLALLIASRRRTAAAAAATAA